MISANLYSSIKLYNEHMICQECCYPLCMNHDAQICCLFSNDGYLMSAGEKGQLSIIDFQNKEMNLKRIKLHEHIILDLKFIEQKSLLLSSSGDCSINLTDLNKQILINSFKFHHGSVKVVCPNMYDSNVFISGCRDGDICWWDIRSSTKLPIILLKDAHIVDGITKNVNVSGITGICSLERDKFMSCATNDDFLLYWDARYMSKYCHNFKVNKKTMNREPFCYLSRKWKNQTSIKNKNIKDERYLHGYIDLKYSNGQLFALSTDQNIYKFEACDLIQGKTNSIPSLINASNKFLQSSAVSFYNKMDVFESFVLLGTSIGSLDLFFNNDNLSYSSEKLYIRHKINNHECNGINGVAFCKNEYGLVAFSCNCGFVNICKANSISKNTTLITHDCYSSNRKDLIKIISNNFNQDHFKSDYRRITDISNVPLNKRIRN